LTSSSQDCEVFIWDLNSKKRKLADSSIVEVINTGVPNELILVGSLVIKGNSKNWKIIPDKQQKIKRQRETKNEILAEALRIRNAVNKE